MGLIYLFLQLQLFMKLNRPVDIISTINGSSSKRRTAYNSGVSTLLNESDKPRRPELLTDFGP